MKYSMLDKCHWINGEKYYQIIALRDVYDAKNNKIVSKGDLGGFIKQEKDLSQDDDSAWVYSNELLIDGKIKKFNDKYEMINPIFYQGKLYYRIRALKDFNDVKKGDLGGFITCSRNLSYKGNCWIYPNAVVKDEAQVIDNAQIYDKAIIQDDALIGGEAIVKNCAVVGKQAHVMGKVVIEECAIVQTDINCDNFSIYGGNKIYKKSKVNTTYKDDSFSIFKGCLGILETILDVILVTIATVSFSFVILALSGYWFFILVLPIMLLIVLLIVFIGLSIYKIIRDIWMVYHLYVQEYKNDERIEISLIKYQCYRHKFSIITNRQLMFCSIVLVALTFFIILFISLIF